MNEIFNKKYKKTLNESQSKILHYYSSNDEESLTELFVEMKHNTLNLLEDYIHTCDNKILSEKYKKINNQISDLSTEDITKESLQKYLLLAKLKEELLGE